MLKLAADHVHLLLVLGQSRQVLEHIVAILQVALHIMGQPIRRNDNAFRKDTHDVLHVVPPEGVRAELLLAECAFLRDLYKIEGEKKKGLLIKGRPVPRPWTTWEPSWQEGRSGLPLSSCPS